MDVITAVFSEFPEIMTPRLRLRRMGPLDAFALFDVLSDDAVARNFGIDTFTDMEQAHQRIRQIDANFRHRRTLRWAVARRDNNLLIGSCGYVSWRPAFHQAAIGYELHRSYWRQGLMSEALTAVINFGLTQMQLHRLEALVLPENTPSRALLTKLGFQQEGLLREYGFWRGEFHDLYIYALLKQDWLAGYGRLSADAFPLGEYDEA
ncbi:MAG: GNAT family protein [Chloroflexota bacterium]|nr:GNAT family N-acetyltransferase [Anaerolineales bacterium]MCA9978062.1 GNAT family N-acetyltransferase [Anaerolineales bacterium]MCB8966721.1 GNAT family N-acetyltransferase [Ardenticatenaceae bacterium]